MAEHSRAGCVMGGLLVLAASAGEIAAIEPKIYYSSGAGGTQVIHRANLDGSNPETVLSSQPAVIMDVDPIGGKVYWLAPSATPGQSIMRRANLDGSMVEDIWGSSSYGQFRIEPYTGKIYYTINAADRIWRASLDGSLPEALVRFTDADPAVSARSFAIDVKNDRLYWTNPGAQTGNDTTFIQYTNLAGTDPVVSVGIPGGTRPPSGIDVDPLNGHVYWKDVEGVWRGDLDLSNPVVIIPPPEGQGSSGNNNLRLDVLGGSIYWAQQSQGKIWRCQLAACTPELVAGLSDTRSIALLLPCVDPFFVDGDGDRVLDGCDNCPALPNPVQSDVDGDGEGDLCDVNDDRLTLWFGAPNPADVLNWDAEFGPFWNVYRGDLAVLRSTGVYSQAPASNPAAARLCDLTATSLLDGYIPGPGETAAYLVTGFDAGLETDLGETSAPAARPHDNPCP